MLIIWILYFDLSAVKDCRPWWRRKLFTFKVFTMLTLHGLYLGYVWNKVFVIWLPNKVFLLVCCETLTAVVRKKALAATFQCKSIESSAGRLPAFHAVIVLKLCLQYSITFCSSMKCNFFYWLQHTGISVLYKWSYKVNTGTFLTNMINKSTIHVIV